MASGSRKRNKENEPMTDELHDALGGAGLPVKALENAPPSFAAMGELRSQVSIAREYPRTMKQVEADIEQMACASQNIAASCFYQIPRAGKIIEGASVRFAEIVAVAWGHTRIGSRVVEIDEAARKVTVEGVGFDAERNNWVSVEVRLPIYGRKDRKTGEYVLDVDLAVMRAQAIARRNATFQIVPRGIIADAYDKVRKTGLGEKIPLDKQQAAMETWMTAQEIPLENVIAFVGRDPAECGIKDLKVDELFRIRSRAMQVRAGEMSKEEAFPPPEELEPPPPAEAVKDALRAAETPQDAPPAEVDADPAPDGFLPADANLASETPPPVALLLLPPVPPPDMRSKEAIARAIGTMLDRAATAGEEPASKVDTALLGAGIDPGLSPAEWEGGFDIEKLRAAWKAVAAAYEELGR
jgi:hypothetical protein